MQRKSGWLTAVVLCVCLLAAASAAPAQNTVPFTTLRSFDGMDGSGPLSGLIQAFDGNLYGTTLNGGANSYEKIFEVTPTYRLTSNVNVRVLP